MKKLYFLLVMLLCCSVSFGQFYNGGTAKLNIDAKGNFNLKGSFQDSMVFNNTVVHSGTNVHVSFIAHTDSALNLKWCRFLDLESVGLSELGLVSDRTGNVYVGGAFIGEFRLDTFLLISTPYTEPKIFLAKYDTSGSLVWYRTGTGNTKTRGFELGIDTADNIYLSSMVHSSITFGDADTLTVPYISAFIAKFDSAGNNLWLAGMPGYKDIYDFQTDPAGNSFIAGTCFGAQACDTQVFTMHDSNSFILKCSPDGVGQWQRTVRGPLSEGYSVGVGQEGKATLVGVFMDSVHFNTLPPLYQTVSGNSGYAVAYSADGIELRASRLESGILDFPYPFKARTDNVGNVNLLCVSNALSLDFGGTHIDVVPYFSTHIIKLDSLHNVLCNVDFFHGEIPYITLDKHDSLYFLDNYDNTGYDTFNLCFYIAKIDTGCSVTNIKIIPSPTISIESTRDIGNASLVQVYPNPVHDALNVTLKGNIAGKITVRVYDIYGRTTLRQESEDVTLSINMGAIAPGIYFVETIADGSRYVTRVVKE